MSALLVVFLFAAVAGPAPAQPAPGRGTVPPDPPRADSPLSLDRVKRRIATQPASTSGGLRLDYYIEVFGRAPAFDLFDPFELRSAAVPYGGMTHGEMLGIITPQEFRSPVMNLSNVASTASAWLNGKQQDREERRREAARRRAEQEALRIRGEIVQPRRSRSGALSPGA
jgi:hypothetical protein